MDSAKPIYVQIAEWIETEIIQAHFAADDKVFSQYQLAEMFTINPATAAKGLNLLVEEEILYKKRGLGMFVAEGAKERIVEKRKNQNLKHLIEELVLEAGRLGVGRDELVRLVMEAKAAKGGGTGQ